MQSAIQPLQSSPVPGYSFTTCWYTIPSPSSGPSAQASLHAFSHSSSASSFVCLSCPCVHLHLQSPFPPRQHHPADSSHHDTRPSHATKACGSDLRSSSVVLVRLLRAPRVEAGDKVPLLDHAWRKGRRHRCYRACKRIQCGRRLGALYWR